MRIMLDDLTSPAVQALISDHLADMRATSPPESIHALAPEQILQDGVTFWTVWDGDRLAGSGALKALGDHEAEIKAMRTAEDRRGQGVGGLMLDHLVTQARTRGHRRLSLETGSQAFFAPARRLYARYGFVECPPFGDYVEDPNSVFMTLELT
ncbi:GNAT family N-acetyltransferase [Georgenia halophila]|uniref:GNAT family N-acetyltransferase n=1 Tax=Georgenia halophila TaxID=620889 RepID=A0ABP8L916_9MICO